MLTKDQIALFLDRMSLAVREGGAIARMLQGSVTNIGKSIDLFPDDSARSVARKTAKTLADEIVQELLLLAAMEVLDRTNIILDAEEETPLVSLFSGNASSPALIIDPIDGTMDYLSERDNYSVCVGLMEQAKMVSALVYFPARDHLYFLGLDGRGYLARDAYTSGLRNAQPLQATATNTSSRIYHNSRVPRSVLDCLVHSGYEIIEDSYNEIGYPDVLLACLAGEALAHVSVTKNMRDLLLGAVIAGVDHAYALDWSGQALSWPAGGRVPRAIFGVGSFSGPLRACLAGFS